MKVQVMALALAGSAVISVASPNFKFDEGGKFRIAQVTDIQEGGLVNPRSLAIFEDICIRKKVDLVVLTGDNVASQNCHGIFEEIIGSFIDVCHRCKTPFVVTFGNHDSEKAAPDRYSRQEQYDIFKKLGGEYFVDHDVKELTGVGSGVVEIKSSKKPDKTAFNIFVMDSGSYYNGKYDGCYADQIAWYERVSGDVPCLWFQHIPVPEIRSEAFYSLVPEGVAGAFHIGDSVWAKINEKFTCGEIHEPPCPTHPESYVDDAHTLAPKVPGGGRRTLYDVWREKGNLRGAYFGHDHKNTFDGTDANGIRLGYGKALTLHSYNDDDPGLRFFEISDDGSFRTDTFTEKNPNGLLGVFEKKETP